MEWDLGITGIAYLAAMSLVFGTVAGLVVGGELRRRVWIAATDALACFVVGLIVSEVVFGWATEEELQPNIDGLSRDEALLSALLTTAVVVVVARRLARRRRSRKAPVVRSA